MHKVRLIPTLLLRDNRMVKGKQFDNYRDTGDPVFAARVYNSQYVDELIFLDIDATVEGRNTNVGIIDKVSKECFMPFSIGGGINSIERIRSLLKVGADKVIINTACYENSGLIKEAAERFGSQCIIVGIDVRFEDGEYCLYSHSGRKKESVSLKEHIAKAEALGAGEIFINNIDRDGMMKGYDNELINLVMSMTVLPVIACGGAGNFMHLVETFKTTGVSALAMASIYHFGDNNPVRARSYLKNQDINIKVV